MPKRQKDKTEKDLLDLCDPNVMISREEDDPDYWHISISGDYDDEDNNYEELLDQLADELDDAINIIIDSFPNAAFDKFYVKIKACHIYQV